MQLHSLLSASYHVFHEIQMAANSLLEKRPSSEHESIDNKKLKLNSEFCAFWLEKKQRNCLTKPVEGFIFCQVHLDKTPNLEKVKKNELQITQSNLNAQEKIRCGFWVARKKRFCKCIPPQGATFCVEHAAQDNVKT